MEKILYWNKMPIVIVMTLFASLAQAVPLSITVVHDLHLGEAPQGDFAKVIPPGNSDNPYSAKFTVTGDPNTVYTVILPSGTVSLTTAEGGANQVITLRSFKSNPTEGSNGQLNAQGNQDLYVGATRDALSQNQATGNYQGQIVVSVVF